jgi:hypothetical protein
MHPPSLLGAFTAAALACSAWCSSAMGQWTVALELGSDRFWGASTDNSPEHLSLRPYRPTTIGLGLERQSGGFGLGMHLSYAGASLALEGHDAVVAAKGIFKMYEAAADLVYQVATLGSGNALLLHAGPLLNVWSIEAEGSQWRVGMHGGVSLRIPLGSRFAGSVLAGVALTSSPFAPDQLDPPFERRALWKRRVEAGLQYRL